MTLLPLENCQFPGCLMIGLDFKGSFYHISGSKKCGCTIESDGDLGINRFMNSSTDLDSVDPAGFTGECYQTLRKKIPILFKSFQKTEKSIV